MSDDAKRPVAIRAADVPPRAFRTNYPEPFASRMAGRDKRPLGDPFGGGLDQAEPAVPDDRGDGLRDGRVVEGIG